MADPPDRTAQIRDCLDRLRAGDDSARRDLLAHVNERLGHLTRKMLRGDRRVRRWEETDDIRQDAMLRLYRALERARPESERDFFRLAALHIRRTLIDLARRHYGPEGDGAHHATDPPPVAGTDHSQDTADPADTTHEPQRLADWTELHQVVARLPDPEREAFDLLWYHELPQAEAAALLGISQRTLQRHWRSARRLIGAALRGERPPE
jgi:RNA polymerase sigma factor (sigma-70 family)